LGRLALPSGEVWLAPPGFRAVTERTSAAFQLRKRSIAPSSSCRVQANFADFADCLIVTSSAPIRVSCDEHPSVSDASNATFSIVPE
jgi:hypothetical protein